MKSLTMHEHKDLLRVSLLQTAVDLLRQCRTRIDASYCQGRIVGPDRLLANEIDALVMQFENTRV